MAWDRTKASDPAHIGPEGLAGRPVAAGSMLHPNRGRRAVKRAAARTDFLVRAQSGDSHQAVGSPETPSSGDGPSADPMSGPEAFSAAFPTRTNLRSTGGPATVVVPSKSDFQTRRARPRRNCGHPSRPQNQFTISPLQHVHQAAPGPAIRRVDYSDKQLLTPILIQVESTHGKNFGREFEPLIPQKLEQPWFLKPNEGGDINQFLCREGLVEWHNLILSD